MDLNKKKEEKQSKNKFEKYACMKKIKSKIAVACCCMQSARYAQIKSNNKNDIKIKMNDNNAVSEMVVVN